MVVLDTDHITLLQHAHSPEGARLTSRLEDQAGDAVATTIVTYEEQTRGWLAYLAKAKTIARQVQCYGKLHRHLENYTQMRVLDFDNRAAIVFQQLHSDKVRIGTMDLKIAAICLAHDATLLTRNSIDFGRVPDLRIEDWSV
ncbi:MAG: type II toxin-antitoxin system VapC family toxin [Planctomycetaceae bacterium]|nr:type II toxin-antitoxin system VapC family toxin [Planctomycetaceae bacterium]